MLLKEQSVSALSNAKWYFDEISRENIIFKVKLRYHLTEPRKKLINSKCWRCWHDKISSGNYICSKKHSRGFIVQLVNSVL